MRAAEAPAPLFDALVEERDYNPFAYHLRTHEEFLADHPRPCGQHKKELPAPRPPLSEVKKAPAKKASTTKRKPPQPAQG